MRCNALISRDKQRRFTIIDIIPSRVNDAPAAWLGEAIDPTWPRIVTRGLPGRPGGKTGARAGTAVPPSQISTPAQGIFSTGRSAWA
jgi:hypothetical protein